MVTRREFLVGSGAVIASGALSTCNTNAIGRINNTETKKSSAAAIGNTDNTYAAGRINNTENKKSSAAAIGNIDNTNAIGTVNNTEIKNSSASTAGVTDNYNLKEYDQYNVWNIEWIKNENRYRARVGFTDHNKFVFFNSYHLDFHDAERMITFVMYGKESGFLLNICAETLEMHTAPSPGPDGETTVLEVLGLTYSYWNGR
jgi:hypothetical protein